MHNLFEMSSAIMDKHEACETEFRRQELYISVEKMLAAMPRDPLADKLPIVELQPFSKKVWRRAKSFPAKYGRPNTQYSIRGGSVYSNILDADPDPRRDTVTPRREIYPRAHSVLSDKTHKMVNNNRHPNTRDKEYFIQHPLGFATPGDREKTTLDDIRSGSSANVHYSCSSRAMSEMDFAKQQSLRVSGQKMKDLPPKVSILYADPTTYYKISKSFTMPIVDIKPDSIVDNLYYRLAHLQSQYSNQYELDRTKTLPNIHLTRQPTLVSRKAEDKDLSKDSSVLIDYDNIGPIGVQNSLEILGQYGRPLGIERQLTTELRNSLNHFRRTKDKSNTPVGQSKPFPALQQREPTIGEMLLKHGIEQNSGKKNGSSIKSISNRGGSRSSYIKSEVANSSMQSPDEGIDFQNGGKLSKINSQQSKDNDSQNHHCGSSVTSLAGSIIVEKINGTTQDT